MPILTADLKILASEKMTDAPDGGGRSTEIVVVDGQSNNMFDDISTLDRTYGAVNLRKVFAAVRTQNDNKFYGSHLAIVKLPADTKLGINLFKTGDHFDGREDAANRIQNYRAQGGKYPAYLWGKQYVGTQGLTCFQSESVTLPVVGDVLVLVDVATEQQQFVKISSVSHSLQSFTDDKGSFTRRVVNFEITTPLERDFKGTEMVRYDTITAQTAIYRSTVANAARYYSAQRLKNAALLGDYDVIVDSIYSQVVPSSQSETPLIDLSAGSNSAPLIESAAGVVTMGITNTLAKSIYVGRACMPNSVIVVAGGRGTLTDSGGYLYDVSQNKLAAVDYLTGIITFFEIEMIYSGSFKPAVAPLVIADTDSLTITDNNRSFVYTGNITPPPQPGALSISFMAMNGWYELRDNGTGAIAGQVDGIGSGSVNYVTGSWSVTLSTLLDVGSELILAWGKKASYTNCSIVGSGSAVTFKSIITKQLSHEAIEAASLVISWMDGTSTRYIVSNAAGVLSGDGAGSLVSTTGIVAFTPTNLPPAGTVFHFSYNYGSVAKITKTLTSFNMVGNTVELNLGDTNIAAGSLVVEWATPWGSSIPNAVLAGDYALLPNPASGVQQQADRDNAANGFIGGRSAIINYATGILSFNWATPLPLKFALFSNIRPMGGDSSAVSSIFRGYLGGLADLGNPTAFIVSYRLTSGSTANSGSDTHELTQINLDLLPSSTETLVPGSVVLNIGTRQYIDRNGQLYYNIDNLTGAGIFGGTIDYSNGICLLPNWASNSTGSIISALSTTNFNPVDRVVFRTAIAPIKPSSFAIRAVQLNGGAQVIGTASETGVISTTNMVGSINNETGVAKVQFGQWVTAAGNEAQPWYNPDMVIGGQIFHPKPVLASTIIYNAVSFTFIPLDKEILGLDSVRLPVDGRIPVYHKGDVVVVLNDQTTTGTFTSSTTTDLGRVRLAKAIVKDLGGSLLAANKYTVNLDTGMITWGDLSGISQPLTIIDRIEDMAVIADVQITGKIKLSKPITHDYPANTTLVSNAVVYGDLYARVSTPFDQQTWTNVWQDTPIGNTVSAEFNDNLYPITVTNSGAIQDRWLAQFSNSSTVNVVGEHVGQIVTGHAIGTDLAPINPATGDPYFSIDYRAWGGGWSAGNVLRFDTFAANAPLWVIQSIGQGDATSTDYGFCIEFRGDVDAP